MQWFEVALEIPRDGRPRHRLEPANVPERCVAPAGTGTSPAESSDKACPEVNDGWPFGSSTSVRV